MLGRAMKRPLASLSLASCGAAASLLRTQQSAERDGARAAEGHMYVYLILPRQRLGSKVRAAVKRQISVLCANAQKST